MLCTGTKRSTEISTEIDYYTSPKKTLFRICCNSGTAPLHFPIVLSDRPFHNLIEDTVWHGGSILVPNM